MCTIALGARPRHRVMENEAGGGSSATIRRTIRSRGERFLSGKGRGVVFCLGSLC